VAGLSVNGRIGVHHAREARAELGVDLHEPLPDVLEAVEALGAPVAVLALAEGVAGAWLGGGIFVNGSEHPVRQRFTLAHELGHVRMDHAPVVDPSGLPNVSDEEVQANAFAADFLMPRHAVQSRVRGAVTLEEVVRLAAEFGVSARMTRIRLQTTNVLTDPEQIARLDEEIAEGLHWPLVEFLDCPQLEDSLSDLALPRLPERPSALAAYFAGQITLDQLAATTGRPPESVVAMLERFGLSS
jgi:plasmid maintenance system antidote protein VapI